MHYHSIASYILPLCQSNCVPADRARRRDTSRPHHGSYSSSSFRDTILLARRSAAIILSSSCHHPVIILPSSCHHLDASTARPLVAWGGVSSAASRTTNHGPRAARDGDFFRVIYRVIRFRVTHRASPHPMMACLSDGIRWYPTASPMDDFRWYPTVGGSLRSRPRAGGWRPSASSS